MTEGLTPGDKVIALASMATTAGLVAGAVAGGIAGWIAKHKVAASVSILFAGAILGWAIGTIMGKILYPAQNGNILVTKWGPSSLALTLKGNIIASFITAIVICGLIALIAKVNFKTIIGPCLVTSLIFGIILALLASLA